MTTRASFLSLPFLAFLTFVLIASALATGIATPRRGHMCQTRTRSYLLFPAPQTTSGTTTPGTRAIPHSLQSEGATTTRGSAPPLLGQLELPRSPGSQTCTSILHNARAKSGARTVTKTPMGQWLSAESFLAQQGAKVHGRSSTRILAMSCTRIPFLPSIPTP